MQILKTTLIEFDVDAERLRIETNFEGSCKTRLLCILDTFSDGNWDACEASLRTLKRSELEFVHYDLIDVINTRRQRQLRAAEAKTGGGPTSQVSHPSLAYPKFQVGDFIG